jgi:hypothetical protein
MRGLILLNKQSLEQDCKIGKCVQLLLAQAYPSAAVFKNLHRKRFGGEKKIDFRLK